MIYKSPLRDLASQIHKLASEHPAFSQACAAVASLENHLCAMARCEEVNRAQAPAESKTQ